MKHFRWSLLLAFVLTLGVTSVVLAEAGCPPPNLAACSNSCPASWDGVNYTCTIAVTTMSSPDHKVCLGYSVDTGGGPGLMNLVACDEPGAPGQWRCLIPNQPNATIAWDMSTWSSGGAGVCGDLKTDGPTGSFTTGPTAVSLAALQAEGGFALPLWLVLAALAGAVAVLGMGAVLLRRRRV